jgi:hypothetical protein
MFTHPTLLSYLSEVRIADNLRQPRTAPRSRRRQFSFDVPGLFRSLFPRFALRHSRSPQATGLR